MVGLESKEIRLLWRLKNDDGNGKQVGVHSLTSCLMF